MRSQTSTPLTSTVAATVAAAGSTRVSRRAIGLALAVTLLLAACGGGDEPGGPAGPAPDGSTAPGGPDGNDAVTGPTGPPSPFTGLPVDPATLERALLIVKIENSENARPQSGMDAADIVIEELVEGGITRFMVMFHSDLPDVAGPIRSARPVDVELLGGFGASGFAYSGARPEVQGLLGATPSVKVVEGVDGFFRDDRRRAPHNLYLRPASVLDVVESRGARPLNDIGWVFDPVPPDDALTCPASAPACADPGASVVIEMSRSFRSGWTYDFVAGVYRRDQNGVPFEASGSGDIGAANVVVLATRHYVGASGYDETDATTLGAPAIVLRDGNRYAARWVKPTAGDLLLIQTPDGRPFPLKPGPTWIHLPEATRMPTLG
jgi:hypothetical protein